MVDKPRILIVDDSARARDSLRALLAIYAENTDIQEAENGLEALKCVDSSRPDIVLMDILMPELDGITATQRIKAQVPQIKIIAVSMTPDYRAEALAAGADAFVCKGDSPKAILEVLIRIAGLADDNNGRRLSNY